MRRKLLWGRMVWRLLIALILALSLISISSSPVVAFSVEDYFSYSYDVEFSKTEINGDELFNATVTVTATRNNKEFPLSLSPSKALITGRIIAEHQATGAEITLNSSYTVEINPFPEKGKTARESEVVALQFPGESQSGTYNVFGEPIEAEIYVLGIELTVTSLLPEFQTMGSVTYVAFGGGGIIVVPPPAGDEVITNLFGTEANSSISSSGEILETIEATSEDGMLTLTIPEGTIALDKDANPLPNLEAEVDASPPPPPEDTSIIGLAHDFGPDGATFDPPITLTRSYDPNDIPEDVSEEDLVLAWYDETADKWVELVDCVVDTSNNTITASIEHFTTFAIMGMVASVPESEPEVADAVFRTSKLDIFPGEVDIGQMITISVQVTNTGNIGGTYQVTLEIDSKVVETQEVTLAGGASDTVTFRISEDVASTYSVNIDGLSGSFVVKPLAISESGPASNPISPATDPPLPTQPINRLIIYGVIIALVAMGSLLFFLVRRSRTKSSS